MKIIDVIFSLICGKIIGFVAVDILKGIGIKTNLLEDIVIWFFFPLVTLFCLWLAFLIGRKALFVFQAAKFFLVGAFATVIDLKLFEVLIWVFSFFILPNTLIIKAASFIAATGVKYWGNKYWAFQKHEKEKIHKEMAVFFMITLIGLIIDVSVFYYATKIVGAPPMIPIQAWMKLSVIFAALAAALCNFLGYKFLVFKK